MEPLPEILRFFEYTHLPEKLANASRPFCELAHLVALKFPSNEERAIALRKLLEAKDAAVRAVIVG